MANDTSNPLDPASGSALNTPFVAFDFERPSVSDKFRGSASPTTQASLGRRSLGQGLPHSLSVGSIGSSSYIKEYCYLDDGELADEINRQYRLSCSSREDESYQSAP